MKLRKLTAAEKYVVEEKGTEAPYSGKYEKNFEPGLYVCKRCFAPLYKSEDKFDAHCGWPSFDDELPGAVKRIKDADGIRTEITCNNCGAHLGHVFIGEHMTKKNVRHCVNSISMDFIPTNKVKKESIVLGGGCFWCVEAVFKLVPGVLGIEPGYAGGETKNPTYEEVCNGKTGHAEVARIEYLADQTNLESILEIFFAMHDPTSLNKQGNDVGAQYRSIILFNSKKQETIIKKYIEKIAPNYPKPLITELRSLEKFYGAENYHKDYFEKNPSAPYCMFVISPKVKKIKAKFDL
jgi:peptide methionine sulfoxide reductase msrA/msrB